jgi:hypothetical protein
MSKRIQPLAVGIALFNICILIAAGTTRADTGELIRALMFVCVGGGSEDKLETQGKGEIALTLRKLRTGDLGASGDVAAKYTKAEWQGLVGGISSQMTEVQAAQADKVRECLKPYMAGIVDAILKATK